MNDFESGYYQCKQDIMKALGISTLQIPLIEYIEVITKRSVAWGLLDEVIDHSVNLHVAANKLRREIEKARGIE